MAHHGEIWQGLFAAPDGRLRQALVTLPCPIFGAKATFVPDASAVISVEPAWRSKAQRAAKLALAHAGWAHVGGRLTVVSPTPPRWGLGSSTSDVLAAMHAVTDALGITLSDTILAETAIQAETASDSIMFGRRAILFAHHEGVVLEDFGGPLPDLEVLGLNTDPTGAGIDTLTLAPAPYTGRELDTLQGLVMRLRQAVRARDAKLLGQVASASARINQHYRPKRHFDRLERLAERLMALGVQVAHSGTVAGLLFDPWDGTTPEKIREAQVSLAEMGFIKTWRFHPNDA